MSYLVEFKDEAKADVRKLQKSGQKKLVDKVLTFTVECEDNPRSGTGKPERLKYRQTETWSREINKQHRFVYEIEDQNVYILSAWGHYGDK